jgi:D-glycero-beta-D-manno-heptose-7-phosphate kinase
MATNMEKLFDSFSGIKVGVIGDVMLDTYWWGAVDRISPEAPVPIVSVQKKEHRLGGAANVALNIKALDADVTLLSVTGDDAEGESLQALLSDYKLKTDYILFSTTRITTNKIRIMCRNQQMMRLDAEEVQDINASEQEAFVALIRKYIDEEKPQVVILQDYNKGVLSASVIKRIIGLCKEHNVIVAVDPKRKNFFAYKDVDIFKPNLKEVRESLNLLSEAVDEITLADIHKVLHKRLQHNISLITLSDKGVFYNDQNEANIIPSHVRNVADVSGAGDTVIAVAALVYAAINDIRIAAEIANIAGGLVCEEVGTAIINRQKLLEECKELLPTSQGTGPR